MFTCSSSSCSVSLFSSPLFVNSRNNYRVVSFAEAKLSYTLIGTVELASSIAPAVLIAAILVVGSGYMCACGVNYDSVPKLDFVPFACHSN